MLLMWILACGGPQSGDYVMTGKLAESDCPEEFTAESNPSGDQMLRCSPPPDPCCTLADTTGVGSRPSGGNRPCESAVCLNDVLLGEQPRDRLAEGLVA